MRPPEVFVRELVGTDDSHVRKVTGTVEELGEETLRQILHGAGLSHQRTRSWKWSPRPDFQPKADRVLSLCREKPADGVVVCFDEMGPIQMIPPPGLGLGAPEAARAAAGDLQAQGRDPLPLRHL